MKKEEEEEEEAHSANADEQVCVRPRIHKAGGLGRVEMVRA